MRRRPGICSTQRGSPSEVQQDVATHRLALRDQTGLLLRQPLPDPQFEGAHGPRRLHVIVVRE